MDPRGLLTPFWDSWSLDARLVRQDGEKLIPSKLMSVKQHLDLEGSMAVVTRSTQDAPELVSRAEVLENGSSVQYRKINYVPVILPVLYSAFT